MRIEGGSHRHDELVVVAPVGWQTRVAELLNQRLPLAFSDRHVTHRATVFEAAAAALLARRQGLDVLLCVMVDYLSLAEMDIFATFSPLAGVRTIAFSACERQKKLAHARLLGADQILGERDAELPQGRETATEALAGAQSQLEEPLSPTGAEVINAMASSAIASATQQARRQEQRPTDEPPARPARPAKPDKKDTAAGETHARPRSAPKPGEALLSQEELDALLG